MTTIPTFTPQGPPGPLAASVAALADLSALPSTPWPQGTIAYVAAADRYFRLMPFSTATPNGTTVLAAAVGNWLAGLPS